MYLTIPPKHTLSRSKLQLIIVIGAKIWKTRTTTNFEVVIVEILLNKFRRVGVGSLLIRYKKIKEVELELRSVRDLHQQCVDAFSQLPRFGNGYRGMDV